MPKRSTRIFLDSNVILSGLFSDKGAPRIILDLLSLGLPQLEAATGQYNIIEIERNLIKKMPEALPVYKKYIPLLNLDIIPFPSFKEMAKLSGVTSQKDIPVLASAVNDKVDYLVTGDKDFSNLTGQYSFKILSPSEFLADILPEILKALESDS